MASGSGRTPAANCARPTSVRPSCSTAGSTPTAAYNDQIFVDLRDRYGLTQVVFEADRRRAVRRGPGGPQRVGAVRARARCARGCRARHNPKLATGDIEVKAEKLHDPQPLSDAAVRGDSAEEVPRRRRTGQRGPAAAISLPRPAPADAAAHAGHAAPAEQGHPRLSRQPGLPRTGDAAAGPQHAGRGPRLPGAEPGLCRAAGTPCRSRRSCTSNC